MAERVDEVRSKNGNTKIAESLHLSVGTVSTIMKEDLCKREALYAICSTSSHEEKEHRIIACENLLRMADNDKIFSETLLLGMNHNV